MNPREFLAKRKAHLFCAGAFIVALSFSITVGLMAGQTLPGATWKAVSEIRPIEYLMLAIFWCAFAVHSPKDDWHSPLVTLNLSQSNRKN